MTVPQGLDGSTNFILMSDDNNNKPLELRLEGGGSRDTKLRDENGKSNCGLFCEPQYELANQERIITPGPSESRIRQKPLPAGLRSRWNISMV